MWSDWLVVCDCGFSLSALWCGEGDGTPLQYSCLENPMDRGAWWAAVHGVAKSQTRLSDFPFTFHFHALEKEMATHSSVLAWRIKTRRERSPMFPWTGMHCFLLFLISVYVHSYNSYLLCTSPHPTTKTPWSKKQTWKMMLGEGNTQTYPDESTQAVSSKQMVSVSNSNKECKYAMFGSLLTKLIIVFMSMGR